MTTLHAGCDHAYDYCSATKTNTYTERSRNTAKLNLILDSIWRLGDRDECSIKHIGHGLAAINAGYTWREGIDYRTPWGITATWTGDGFREWTPAQIEKAEAKLSVQWDKVTRMREEIGPVAFRDSINAGKFHFYANAYGEEYWGNS